MNAPTLPTGSSGRNRKPDEHLFWKRLFPALLNLEYSRLLSTANSDTHEIIHSVMQTFFGVLSNSVFHYFIRHRPKLMGLFNRYVIDYGLLIDS